MNLGPIKDKSTKKHFLKNLSLNRGALALAVCCVAVIGVTAAFVLTVDNGNVTKEAAKPTPSPYVNAQTGNQADVLGSLPTQSGKLPQSTAETQVGGNATVEKTAMVLPVASGEVLRGFSSESLVYLSTLKHWATHTALDLKAAQGAPVLCAMDGTVEKIEQDSLMGNTITIAHANGLKTVYSALEACTEGLKAGDNVIKGQAIGKAGNTASCEIEDGVHLHFEVLKDNVPVNPQNYLSGLLK